MTMLRANFGDLLAPGMNHIFQNMFNLYPSGIEQIYNMMTSKRQYETDSYVTGFGLVPQANEGAPVAYDDIIQGLDTEYNHDTYKLAYGITREMYEDERYGAINRMPESLGRSTRITIETDGANQLNRAETAGYTGADGKTLLSTTHDLVGGGTQKNRLTSAADFAMSSLEQALIDIAETTDDRGLPLHLNPIKLIYPVELDWTVKQVLKSGSDPSNANDQFNPAGGILTPICNHFLTDPDAWFIECSEHYMYWYWRVKPEHSRDNDFSTDNGMFKVRMRWSRGWSMPWGIFGSMGV